MSNRLVKCRLCELKNKQKDSYQHIENGKNVYFCNEKHYKEFYDRKHTRQEILTKCNELFGIKVSTDTFFLKELKEYEGNYKALLWLLEDRFIDIDLSLSKEFRTLNFKIKYFFAIVKKDITNYIEQQKQSQVVYHELEITSTNYKQKKRRKTILEILKENDYDIR